MGLFQMSDKTNSIAIGTDGEASFGKCHRVNGSGCLCGIINFIQERKCALFMGNGHIDPGKSQFWQSPKRRFKVVWRDV